MKALAFVLGCVIISGIAYCQPFTGLSAANNTILQVQDNPAFAVSDNLLQLNLAALSATFGGNSFNFRTSIFSFPGSNTAVQGVNYFKDNTQGMKTMWANVVARGPGASFVVKKKYFFALTSGLTYLMNSNNLTSKVFGILGGSPLPDTTKNDTMNIRNYTLTSQVYSEINLTYAGFIYQSESYNLVGGISFKALEGIGAAAVTIPNASFVVNYNDGVAYHFTGKGAIAFTPFAHTWAVTGNPLNAINQIPPAPGVGFDLGLVYYLNPNELMQVKKGYLVRFAASITDIGSINYPASNTSGNYQVTNKNINYRFISNEKNISYGNILFNNYLIDTTLKAKSLISNFNVKLPTALHLDADLKPYENFYINFNALLNLRKPSADVFSSHYVTTFSLNPRYLYHDLGIGVPFSFNTVSQGYIGLIVYIGPLFFGSGSAFQMATANTFSSVNIFAGAKWKINNKESKYKSYL